jgi:D-alanyl-lipoteichoic acid acyltransferase DltB (MBOAT superfamily)
MLFHTLTFAIFFPIVFGLYLALQKKLNWQNAMLLVASYVFYGWWDWRYISLLLASTVLDYYCGQWMEDSNDKRRRKLIITVSITCQLLLLGVFKYFDFFTTSFADFLALFGVRIDPLLLNLVLPIGISFYTFQTMSYTIDVYRKKLPASRNFIEFALYVSYFPQLVAGPIERSTRLLPQIQKPRTVTLDNCYKGAYLFFWGLFHKAFIADNLAKMVDPVFAEQTAHQGSHVLLATYAFAIQIYSDFAGYSFMALGLALMMGITLMENFKRPYYSPNISDFWRRWHISLSSWFRDYVFTPFYLWCEKRPILKKLPMKKRHGIAFFVALTVAEFGLGLWHGAAWTFAMFGVYHALAIWAYYKLRKPWDAMPFVLQVFMTFQVAAVGWLIFRAPSLSQAGDMFASLFTNFGPLDDPIAIDMFQKLFLYTIILWVVQVFQERKGDMLVVLTWPWPLKYGFITLLLVLIFAFGDFSARPFIYFQF